MSDAIPLAAPAAAALELSLHPDDAGRLPRLPELARLRVGRARLTHVHLVWYDTPDGSLAADGMALCERRVGRESHWRLERMRGTPDAPWPPGSPAPIVAEAALLADLGHRLPGPLLPVTACTGQLRTLPLGEAAGSMTVSLLEGTLRAVAAERPVCRVLLSGPARDIEALAHALAQHTRLSVPAAALAAEACQTAGREVPPAAIGAPVLPTGMAVGAAFAAVAGHLAAVILHWAPDALTGDRPEPVHQMRVALRRLRSALSLFRRAVGDEPLATVRRDLKALQGALGPARDWDVFTAGTGRAVAAALPDDKPVARLLAAAERKRQDSYVALRAFLDGPEFRRLGLSLACLTAFRPWERDAPAPTADEDGDEAAAKRAAVRDASLLDFATRALERRLEHLLAPGEDLTALTAEELHGVRIQAKRLRYAAEFFAPLYPARETRRFLRRVTAMQERLGHLNDGAVAAGLLAELGGNTGERGYAVGVVRGFVAAGMRGTRAKSDRTWRKLFRAEPFWT
jgi:triphosphatase